MPGACLAGSRGCIFHPQSPLISTWSRTQQSQERAREASQGQGSGCQDPWEGTHILLTATPVLGKNRDDQGSSGAIFPSLKNRYGPGWRSGFPPFAWSQTEDFWGLWERVTGKQFLAQPQKAYRQGFHREYQWSSDNAWTKLLLRVPQKGHLPGWDRPSGVRAGRPHALTSSLHELEATASRSP